MLAEKPSDQPKRLAALHEYGVLDSAPDADFDDITTLGARLLDAPVVLVSLVDDSRQWFKSAYGTDLTETPLEESVCSHAILCDGLLEIPDTLADPRTQDNPLCKGPFFKMRFYAGAPLVTPSGQKLGTLCMLDDRPRHLTRQERDTLGVLAKQVMRLLELNRALRLEQSLRDEIDHRVKNSMQAVSSLIRVSRARSETAETRAALDLVARRVTAVTALHEALYRSPSRGGVPLDQYINDIIHHLEAQAPQDVALMAAVAPETVDPDVAHAMVLVLNEFAANTFKHAFPYGGPGQIRLEVARDGNDLVMTCADNGAEASCQSAAPDLPHRPGIGKRLMEAAAEKIRAQLEVGPADTGYALRMRVPLTGALSR